MLRQKISYSADLHNHTTASDGSLTPSELVAKASEIGLKAVAVTDHDTIDGLAEALAAGKEHGIDVVPGIEITLRFTRTEFTGSLHLLVYFAAELLDNDKFCHETRELLAMGRGPALTRDRIAAINREFAPDGHHPLLPEPLTESHVYAHGDRISRRHFALALKAMGITDKEVISSIIGNDSPAYIPSGVPLESARNYLRTWPLTRVLAHPAAGSFPGESLYREVLPPFETVDRLLPEFLAVGLDGFEVEYPGHTEAWKQKLRTRMDALGLTVESGGSDCHDPVERPLGVAGTGMDAVNTIRECFRSRM